MGREGSCAIGNAAVNAATERLTLVEATPGGATAGMAATAKRAAMVGALVALVREAMAGRAMVGAAGAVGSEMLPRSSQAFSPRQ